MDTCIDAHGLHLLLVYLLLRDCVYCNLGESLLVLIILAEFACSLFYFLFVPEIPWHCMDMHGWIFFLPLASESLQDRMAYLRDGFHTHLVCLFVPPSVFSLICGHTALSKITCT